jgi:hypothetical protein
MDSSSTERILFAMIGGSVGASAMSTGLLCEGACVPLAATPLALEVIEELGEELIPEWMLENDVQGPRAGGLWVAEMIIVQDIGAPHGWNIEGHGWRIPRPQELEDLVARQVARVEGKRASTKDMGWTFIGALV